MNANADPDPMTLGPDGNVWFIDQNAADRAVGRVTPAGTITEFDQGLSQNNAQDDITVGADGNVWVEQASQDGVAAGGIARITPMGAITEFTGGLNTNPGQGADGDALLSGSDGNLWFSDRGSEAIGKISLQIPPTATTGPASAVANTTATVSGTINPLGSPRPSGFNTGRPRGSDRLPRPERCRPAATPHRSRQIWRACHRGRLSSTASRRATGSAGP